MYISSPHIAKHPYRPGLDRFLLYKNIWQRHWNGFRAAYDERFAPTYGPLTGPAIWEVRKLIACGSYRNGFRRHTCPDCGTVLIIPFTCKSRLCLSCYRKKIFGWSIHLSYIMSPGFSSFRSYASCSGEYTSWHEGALYFLLRKRK